MTLLFVEIVRLCVSLCVCVHACSFVCLFVCCIPDLSGAAGYRSRRDQVFRFWRPASVLSQGPTERNLEPLYLDPRCSLIFGQGLIEKTLSRRRTLPIGFYDRNSSIVTHALSAKEPQAGTLRR